MLHGHGQDGQQFASLSQINAEADKKGFIAVYPDAVQWFGDKNQSAWNANDGLVPPGSNSDDVQFVNSIIDTTAKQLPVDSNRVYVAGYSNGGMLAAEVANKLSDKVAAVGLVSTGMGESNAQKTAMLLKPITKMERMEPKYSSTPYLVAITPGTEERARAELTLQSMQLMSCGTSSPRIPNRARRPNQQINKEFYQAKSAPQRALLNF